MNYHRTTCTILFAMIATGLPAGAQDIDWMQHLSASFFSFGNGAAVDADGNFYITGYAGGSLDFGGKVIDGAGLGDFYVAKYNSQRRLQWVSQGTSDGWNGGRSLAIGSDGSVYAAGRIEGVTTFGGTTVSGVGDNDAVLVKYHADGKTKWVVSGGGSGMDWANGVAVDGEGNSYMVGYYTGSAAFGGHSVSSAGETDIFVAAYAPDGTLRWIESAGGSGVDEAYDVAVDGSGNVYVAGNVTGNANFGAATLAAGGFAGFLAKYSSDGVVQWVKGAPGENTAETIAIGTTGRILVAGSYRGQATFGGTTLKSAGSNDIYVAGYAPGGDLESVRSYGGTGEDGVAGLGQSMDNVAATDGGWYMCSSFSATLDLGAVTLESRGESDIFVARFDDSGAARWAIGGGGTDNDHYVSMGVDGDGIAYLLGNYFSPTFTMGTTTLPRFGSVDMVMARIDGSSMSGLPRVSLSRSEVNLGEVALGGETEEAIRISAGSNVPLTVTGIRFRDPGGEADGFSISEPASDLFPIELSGPNELPVVIHFAPVAAGEAAATLVVETDDPATPDATIEVTGTGIDESNLPRAVVSVADLDFGEVRLGTTTSRSFTIMPGTKAGLTVSDVEFEDPNSVDDGFFLVAPTSLPVALNQGDSLEVVVEYTPVDLGSFEARISITTNDDADPFHNVDMVANATEAPAARIDATELAFGTIDIGSSERKSLTVRSTGGGTLSVRVELGDGTSGAFHLISPDSGRTQPLTLHEGQELNVTVEFVPEEVGSLDGAVVIESNDPLHSRTEIPLTGAGKSVSSAVTSLRDRTTGPVRVVPNPLVREGDLVIDVSERGRMVVELIDMNGRRVAQLFSGEYNGGERRISLNAREIPAGHYFCRVAVGGRMYHRVIGVER